MQEDTSPSKDQDKEDSSTDEEQWDCKIIVKIPELSKAKPQKCQTEGCDLVACCGWVSNKNPEEIWYGCLDCQADGFGGFPDAHELPLKYMTEEHRKLILEECTNDPEVSLDSCLDCMYPPAVLLVAH